MAQSNLVAAWIGILAGMLSGGMMGMRFHREDWLGGYASLARRMLRLGHVACFALGTLNLMFFLTVRAVAIPSALATVASAGFIIGAFAMPLCCAAVACGARIPPWLLFAVPVASLTIAAICTLAGVIRS